MEKLFSDRYSRQMMLPGFGAEGQEKLSEASVLIVGAGGLGSPVAIYLAGAGVGHIGIADPDCVSLSNLQRQILYTEAQIGQPKTECARERLVSFSSHTRLSLYNEGLTCANGQAMVADYDIVVDCTDNFPTRYMIDDICMAERKPWVHGAIGEFQGQVTVFNYRKRRHYSDLFPDREAMCTLPQEIQGVIGAVPGVIGSIMASETIKLITGLGEPLDGKLFTINLLTLSTELIEF